LGTFEIENCSGHLEWLVWCSGDGVGHINKVELRRARLALGLVTTGGECTIRVFTQFTQAHSAWPSVRG